MLRIRRLPLAIALTLLTITTSMLVAWRAVPAPLPAIHVVKSPTCGCCTAWVDYMKKQGFTVTVEHKADLTALKRANGVTRDLESCHTAFVAGYVVEGHVPAELIKKLLTDKPAGVKGIAVPGMPMGSPGMEGDRKDRYTIYTFDAKGRATPYAQR